MLLTILNNTGNGFFGNVVTIQFFLEKNRYHVLHLAKMVIFAEK